MEVGAEKLRYLHGHAIATNASGEVVVLYLSDTYELAEKKLGGEVTLAEYY